MDYDLTRLGPNLFEHFILALAKEALGKTPQPFRNGYYGGREAAFGEITIAWPSDLGGEIWGDLAVIHADFLDCSSGVAEDTQWFLERIRAHLTTWQNAKRQNTGRRVHISYTLFVTNVTLLELPQQGLKKVNEMIAEFARELNIKGWKIWHYRNLCNLIDNAESIRSTFAGFIAPKDMLLHLADYRIGISQGLGGIIKRQIATELAADQWVRLSQVGNAAHEKLSLSSVGIDLPLISETLGAAQYIVNAGDQILRPKFADRTPPHLVLVGGPGQGKTTIGQIVCQAYRAALLPAGLQIGPEVSKLLESHREGLRRIGLSVPKYRRWPIRIELSNYGDAASGSERTPLLKYIATRLGSRTSSNVQPARVRKWLQRWPWLLVLDGLDEVASAFARDTLMDRISEFIVEADLAQADLFIVATTRPQGYTGEFTADRYQHLSLAPLTPRQAVRYAERLAGVRHADDPDMRVKVVDRTRVAANEQFTARLMRTPLQVTIMSILLEARERAPQARYALFDAYYDTIYAREVSKPGSMARLLESRRNDINVLHDRVGLLLQAKSEKEGEADASIPRDSLRQLSEERLRAEGYSADDALKLADDILAAVTRRLVLIVPKAIDDVGFEVRSIQEFMAARALVSGPDVAVSSRLRAIVPSVHWRNTWLFAAGRIFAEREHMRRDLIELLAEVDNSDLLNMVVAPGADLALDLLDDDLTVAAPFLERVLARHALTLLQYPPDGDLVRRAAVLFRFANKDDIVCIAAEQQLSQALNGNQAQQKAAEAVLQIWKNQEGTLAFRSRQIIDSLELAAKRSPKMGSQEISAKTVADLVIPRIREADLSEGDRSICDTLIEELSRARIRPKGAPVQDATMLLNEVPVSRSLIDECLSRPAISDLLAAAAMSAAEFTWHGSAELRNLLRAWLQRRYGAGSILELTPFLESTDGQV